MDNIIFEKTLYQVEDFYRSGRMKLLMCSNCGCCIEKGGLLYEKTQFKPKLVINKIHFHFDCYSHRVSELEIDKEKPHLVVMKKGERTEYNFMPSSPSQTV